MQPHNWINFDPISFTCTSVGTREGTKESSSRKKTYFIGPIKELNSRSLELVASRGYDENFASRRERG